MVKAVLPLRGEDSYGSGAFHAPRGNRLHNGVDYACVSGYKVCSPVDGEVTKLGYPYADHLEYRYVEVTNSLGDRHRLFYVEPTVELGEQIKEGDVLGVSQDLEKIYPNGMKNHVHYEIIGKNGFINPEG